MAFTGKDGEDESADPEKVKNRAEAQHLRASRYCPLAEKALDSATRDSHFSMHCLEIVPLSAEGRVNVSSPQTRDTEGARSAGPPGLVAGPDPAGLKRALCGSARASSG